MIMEVKVDSKICGVCGDKALGYNFNAITCESCKAFFRRNALANKDLRCPFNQQCEINTVTRRFCQRCRLEKCFTIGMRKDYIMSEQEKVLKRQKIQENKAKKRSNPSNGFKQGFKKIKREGSTDDDSQEYDTTSDYGDIYSPNDTNNLISIDKIDSNTDNISNNTSIIDESMIRHMLNPTPNSSLSPDESLSPVNNNETNCNNNSKNVQKDDGRTPKDILEDVQNIPIEANSIESILCEAIKLEYEAYSSIAQYQGNSRELNDAERAKLNELIVANKALLTPVDDDISTLIAEECRFKGRPDAILANPALVDIINLTAVAIRRLIKMAKKINAFKNMCQEDQVALLKAGCTEMLMLRSLMIYDDTKQTWRIPHRKEYLSSLKADVLKEVKGNFFKEHERFIQTFDPKWRSDENIVLILCAIALFTPDRPGVIHQDVIKLEQNSYYYLLRRYLESTFPGCEAKSTFLKLIQKISELHKLNEEVVSCYLNVNPSEVEPLLIEIFDLKH
ncbi:nuclear hormone receptor HR96 isoform X1 [Onthophagus taurus]|uniref:nuclear hormone receptor HR96 isoform X1 n=1 Tax=Onthophagus taurus TaxID=166361 RepID=UPI0039BE6C57